jgi:hypothetical protein
MGRSKTKLVVQMKTKVNFPKKTKKKKKVGPTNSHGPLFDGPIRQVSNLFVLFSFGGREGGCQGLGRPPRRGGGGGGGGCQALPPPPLIVAWKLENQNFIKKFVEYSKKKRKREDDFLSPHTP